MDAANLSTTIVGDMIITHLTGRIGTADVNEWFIGYEQCCLSFIRDNRKFKLLVDRKGYTPEHFTVQKLWKELFFNVDLLGHCYAMAFLMEEGEVMEQLRESNTKKSVEFFSDYEQCVEWLSAYTA